MKQNLVLRDERFRISLQNYRYSMCLGISQLNKLKKFVSYRRKIANNYDKLFSKIPGIKVLQNMQRKARTIYMLLKLILKIRH